MRRETARSVGPSLAPAKNERPSGDAALNASSIDVGSMSHVSLTSATSHVLETPSESAGAKTKSGFGWNPVE